MNSWLLACVIQIIRANNQKFCPAQHEGLFLGSSSCVNTVAAVKAARRLGPGHTIVTLLCDSGTRHMTRFWSDDLLDGMGLNHAAPARDDLSWIGSD